MALQPPIFLQTQTYDGSHVRYMLSRIIGPGVDQAGDYLVAQRGAGANMSVDVAAGFAWVAGTDTAFQGNYGVLNDATVNVAFAAADATNPRIDRVVLHVYDSTVVGSGHGEGAFLEVVQGTPSSGATLTNLTGAGAVPTSSLLLANVLVNANATSITTSVIQNVAGAALTVAPMNLSMLALSASQSWAVPAALTEWNNGSMRTQADLSIANQVRLVAHATAAGGASAELRAQYSTDGGTTWFYLDGASGPGANVTATGVRTIGWVTLTSAARADVQIRVVGINGNGSTSAAVRAITLQVR